MRTEEMIKVMQAYNEGKGHVEVQVSTSAGWKVIKKPTWNWECYNYRIKPAPIVYYINMYPNQHLLVSYSCQCHKSREGADEMAGDSRIACIRIEFEEGQYDE